MPGQAASVTAVLRGRDHPTHGAVAVAAPTDRLAVATSAGMRSNPSPPLDPNEDCAAVALGSRAALLTVADAHYGCDAAELAVASVLAALGDDPPDHLTAAEAVSTVWNAGMAVQRGTSRHGSDRTESRTTLALALVTANLVHWVSFGDSCVLLVSDRGGRRLDIPRPVYLGFMFSTSEIGGLVGSGSAPREPGDVVVLATDGLVDYGVPPGGGLEDVVAACTDGSRGAEAVARRLVEHALRRDARDAISVAVSAGWEP